MDNVISIVNAKPSNFDFNIGYEGLSPKKMEVRFCLKASNHCLTFKCKKGKGNTWNCDLPALPHLEKGAYPFFIEVVADGYYFEIAKGTANVTGSFDVYVKNPDKVKPGKPEKQKETKQPPKKNEEGKRKTEKKAEKVAPPKKTKEAADYDFSKAAKVLNKILSEEDEVELKAPTIPDSMPKLKENKEVKKESKKEEKPKEESKKTDFSKAAAVAEKLLSKDKKEPVVETKQPSKAPIISKTDVAARKILEEVKKEANTPAPAPTPKVIKKKKIADVQEEVMEKAPNEKTLVSVIPTNTKLDNIVKQIVSETKGTETKAVQEAVKRVVPENIKKKIILAEKKDEKLDNILTEKEKRELSEIDKAVKNILEEQHKEKVEEQKKASPVKFRKGGRSS